MSEKGLQKYNLWRSRTSDAWGFKITTVDSQTFITAVYNDTPAEKAGVALNDVIVTINKIPCYNMSHEYVYHVIRNVDHDMSLVTRKATPQDLQAVGDLTKERMLPYFLKIYKNYFFVKFVVVICCYSIKEHEIITADVGFSSSKGINETKRKSKSMEGNRELRHKDEKNGKESIYPGLKLKNRILSTVDADENHSNKHRRHDSVGKGEGKEDLIPNQHEEKRKLSSNTIPPNVPKEAIEKESKSHKRLTRTLENNLVNNIEEDGIRQARTRTEGINHREDKIEKNRESRVVSREYNSPKTKRETFTGQKESATRLGSAVEKRNSIKIESNSYKKSEITTGKKPQMIKSKSTVGFDTTEPDHVEKEDAEAVSEMKRPFPSMIEIRANLQAGKRRTLLLSRGDSFEDRVDLLNNL
ncbi:unnamed protein product [Rodentolepis nana]|uniref:PDZ domain-containing protein n=1 Tax=Rodentolepis nana TaxID=102285 RepID=A0A0R3T2T6_RODNA|nr:unnamed protein product [Rodentolepis nana]